MTDQSTMTLAERVLAAIEETERIARAALLGPWTAAAYNEITTSAPVPDNLVVAHGDCGGGVYDDATAAHIAHNDPATVLLGCEGNREIVGLHSPHDAWRGPELQHVCTTCGQIAEGDWVDGFYPCDTLRALAKRYGIEA